MNVQNNNKKGSASVGFNLTGGNVPQHPLFFPLHLVVLLQFYQSPPLQNDFLRCPPLFDGGYISIVKLCNLLKELL